METILKTEVKFNLGLERKDFSREILDTLDFPMLLVDDFRCVGYGNVSFKEEAEEFVKETLRQNGIIPKSTEYFIFWQWLTSHFDKALAKYIVYIGEYAPIQIEYGEATLFCKYMFALDMAWADYTKSKEYYRQRNYGDISGYEER